MCFAVGCLLSDGQGSAGEALRLAGLAALTLGLAAWAGPGRGALLALGGAALALGAAAAAVERLEVESRPLSRKLAGGTLASGLQRAGWTPLASYRAVVAGYAALGGLLLLLFQGLSRDVEAPPPGIYTLY